MERQTLQQQVPVYHVCQECGGEGCAACSDLCILDGDIQLDPEWKPFIQFIVVWKLDVYSFNKCFTNESEAVAHFESVRVRATSSYMVYPDGQLISGEVKP